MKKKEQSQLALKGIKRATSPGGKSTVIDVTLGRDVVDSDDSLDGYSAEKRRTQDKGSIQDQLDDLIQDQKKRTDAAMLAAKYDVDDSSSGEELVTRFQPVLASPQIEESECCSAIRCERDQLTSALSGALKEIRRLKLCIEGMQPIPGLDPNKMLKMLAGKKDDTDIVDPRDTKIIQLLKNSRAQTVRLNAENAKLQRVTAECESLRAELLEKQTAKSQNNHNNRNGSNSRTGGRPSQKEKSEINEMEDELERVLMALNIEKQKGFEASEELRKAKRALASEIGDPLCVDKAIAGLGWKGRAQQISVLKNKLKAMEEANQKGGREGGGMQEDIGTVIKQLRKAHEESSARAQALAQETETLKQAAQHSKTRIRLLEQDNGKLRDSLKLVLAKTDTDDRLITGLRQRIAALTGGSYNDDDEGSSIGNGSTFDNTPSRKSEWRTRNSSR